MKQKFAILLAVVGLGMSQPLALIQASESSDLASSTGNNRQDESPSKEKGSRQNPIPLGEALDYEKKSRDGSKSQLSFTILESWRGKKARDQYESRYMLGGGSVKGYVILPAPKEEKLLLKVKNELANKEIYFEIGSKNP